MILDRIINRIRPHDAPLVAESRRAVARTEQIRKRVEDQQAEVEWHDRFAHWTIGENHLSPKIARAIETRRRDA